MIDFNLDLVARERFCLLPTPIHKMQRLSEEFGKVNIFVKRDDLTGIAFGGNKNRKLEYLLADAKAKGADVVLTEGALTSNHCLQTAACAAKLGMKCELVLSDAASGEKITGNILLNQILDTPIHRVSTSEERKSKMEERAEILTSEGKTPYVIPTGGSNRIGIFGYINCMKEIVAQSKEMNIKFDYFVFGTGSAGTQAGLIAGKLLYYPDIEIIGINAGDNREGIISTTKEIIEQFEKDWSLQVGFKDSDIIVNDEYFGEGYGIASPALIETVKLVAKLEGIFLDPVYNGKAMVGLIDLIRTEKIPQGSNVLFLHSGGGPAIFAFDDVFGKKL
ncbi:MAG: D-cysteine desulfhydrase family protein [Candidatus Heimdallarchaeota archaeon]